MIVNYCEEGWKIITQRSHGLLAAQICAQWKQEQRPRKWMETLIACAEHDDFYNELEREDLLTDNGGPRNFKMTDFVRRDAEVLIHMAETKSAYIAALISRHIRFVHGQDKKATAFCKKLRQQEQTWSKITGITTAEADYAYNLLQFCDAFSLLICQQMIQPENRSIEISKGPDGTTYSMHSIADRITVKPWPFEVPSFELNYEYRLLQKLSFTDASDFRKAFADSIAVEQHLTLSSK